MNVYYRYFQVKDEPTLTAIADLLDKNLAYKKELMQVQNDVGASGVYRYASGGFAGFTFEEEPDANIFKKIKNNLYAPKVSTTKGRALDERITSLGVPQRVNDCLLMSGLYPDFCLSGAGSQRGIVMYSASICGSEKAGWFAVVPWRDEDPSTIEIYKKENAAGTRHSAELDHLLWSPPTEWVEIKKWEVEKAIEDAKTRETP